MEETNIERICLMVEFFENQNIDYSKFEEDELLRFYNYLYKEMTKIETSYEKAEEEAYYEDDSDYNEDMGFDPYSGCYTFDC